MIRYKELAESSERVGRSKERLDIIRWLCAMGGEKVDPRVISAGIALHRHKQEAA